MASSAAGSDSIGNAPFPTDPEFEGKSNLYATRDKPGAQDKAKMQNTGVPVDSARTGIPIVVLGKSEEVGAQVSAFLQPTYLVIHHAVSIPALMKRLPTLTNPRPAAVYLGGGFSEEEQNEVEAKVAELGMGDQSPTVVKSRPPIQAIEEKYGNLPFEDRVPKIVKAHLDSIELRELPPNVAAVTENAV